MAPDDLTDVRVVEIKSANEDCDLFTVVFRVTDTWGTSFLISSQVNVTGTDDIMAIIKSAAGSMKFTLDEWSNKIAQGYLSV